MRTIELTQGKVALVDDEDFEALSQHKWHAHKGRHSFYASRNEPTGVAKPRYRTVTMHATLTNTPKGMHTDHIDGDGLNNCRSNLRVVTIKQNNLNRTRKKAGCSSQFRGVSWFKSCSKWWAQIVINGKAKSLGFHDSEHAAAQAYDDAGLARDPEHFTPNFPRITIEIDRSA